MLIERNITKPELRQMVDISPATLTKLNKNLHVTMEMLEKICRALNCTFDDVVEMLPEGSESAE
ncbi:MAG: helix-turn-helix transcriptional regulator [Oscillospiraceae bacterium]|jgi:DNA-binding Xre family transcriptional regulator|nr:helix-turn-helix transcriptional regulator [Oscillospiraceae bacterium]